MLVATLRLVPNSSDPQTGRLDIGGFVLGAVGLGSVIFAGISGEQYGYRPAGSLRCSCSAGRR